MIPDLGIAHVAFHYPQRIDDVRSWGRRTRQETTTVLNGRAAATTHDYRHNGTTTLFAALNALDGQVIGQCQQHHTHIEWLHAHFGVVAEHGRAVLA
jgi:hypothetical protein